MNEALCYECCGRKKQERTKAKQQVTTASHRLTRAVDRGVDIDILTVLMVELEDFYDDASATVQAALEDLYKL